MKWKLMKDEVPSEPGNYTCHFKSDGVIEAFHLEQDDLDYLNGESDFCPSNFVADIDGWQPIPPWPNSETEDVPKVEPWGLFATPNDVKVIEQFIEKMPKEDQAYVWTVVGMTWNFCCACHKQSAELLE